MFVNLASQEFDPHWWTSSATSFHMAAPLNHESLIFLETRPVFILTGVVNISKLFNKLDLRFQFVVKIGISMI